LVYLVRFQHRRNIRSSFLVFPVVEFVLLGAVSPTLRRSDNLSGVISTICLSDDIGDLQAIEINQSSRWHVGCSEDVVERPAALIAAARAR